MTEFNYKDHVLQVTATESPSQGWYVTIAVMSFDGRHNTDQSLGVDQYFDTEPDAMSYGIAMGKKWVDDHV